MTVVSFSMAYRSFWGGSGRLDTHLDTPPSINRRHLDSCLAPIQIGENFYGPRALYTALQMKACDYVMPDFMRIGGVTGWQRAAAIAAAAGIPISTHLYPEVAAHVMRVAETAHWLEWQDWANPILQQPYRVKDGKVHIPDVPGLGLEWDETAVGAQLVD